MGAVAMDRGDEDSASDNEWSGPTDHDRVAVSVHSWVDVFHTSGFWLEAQVQSISHDSVLIHYKGFKSTQDEWIHRLSPRIGPLHSHTLAPDTSTPNVC